MTSVLVIAETMHGKTTGHACELLGLARRFGRGGETAVERGHAAIGAGVEPLRRHEAQRLFDRRGDLFRRLSLVRRHVNRAEQHVLAGEQRQ